MNEQKIRKIKKQIKDSNELLKKLELRPCQGDSDLRQKAIEIEELEIQITSLEKERDGYLYYWQKKEDKEDNENT